jgi:hypothetical protein
MHFLRALDDKKRETNRVGYDRDNRVITVKGATRVTTTETSYNSGRDNTSYNNDRETEL